MAFFNGLSHIGIPTKDFYKSTELYEKLGFELIDQEDNLGSKVNFYQINDLILEVYEDKTNSENGAINHFAIATDEIDKTFAHVKKLGFELIDDKIMHLPFFEHGISYFNFYGPNHETIEVCQKNKE